MEGPCFYTSTRCNAEPEIEIMKTCISYMQGTREERDEQALKDIRGYLSDKQWDALMDCVKRGAKVPELNFYLSFMGIEGYPVHAFLRKYRLAEFRAWMHEDNLDHGLSIMTDEQGFPLGVTIES